MREQLELERGWKQTRRLKLNLVADYEIGGKRLAAALTVDASQNLARLTELATLSDPHPGGATEYIAPSFLLMCGSRRHAEEVASEWNSCYREGGIGYLG